MAGWLHGVCVGACRFVSPLCGFSLSLFCNYCALPVGVVTHPRVAIFPNTLQQQMKLTCLIRLGPWKIRPLLNVASNTILFTASIKGTARPG